MARLRPAVRLRGDRKTVPDHMPPEAQAWLLKDLLKQLSLSGILDSLEARNREAIDRKLAFTDFLSLLIHDEVARRDQKKLAQRIAARTSVTGRRSTGSTSTACPA